MPSSEDFAAIVPWLQYLAYASWLTTFLVIIHWALVLFGVRQGRVGYIARHIGTALFLTGFGMILWILSMYGPIWIPQLLNPLTGR